LQLSCTIAFCGVTIGLSELAAGAGALLLSEDGSLVSTLCNNSFGFYII